MNEQEILREFESAEAILRGHFVLSSGLHSDTYLQCARVLMNPVRAEKLCAALAKKVNQAMSAELPPISSPQAQGIRGLAQAMEKGNHVSPATYNASRSIDLVVAPAMGGVVVGYEMGRQLGVESIFCERENGAFTLRRGFAIPPGARILLVEDVVTTGKSSLETVECIRTHGGVVVAEASLIDRSGGESKKLPFPLFSLLTLDVRTYAADALPTHLAAIPAIKPGSRFLKK
ncbi:MAG: orotate phosphoribosyltransferase [Alphaproteobacteria bacterium]